MKKILTLCVALTLPAAMAERIDNVSTAAFDDRAFSIENGPGMMSTGFDSSEGFGTGVLNGQNGWTVFNASTAQPIVSDANPAGGDQHMRIEKDPAIPTNTLTGGFSPDMGALPVGPSTTSIDVAINMTGGADYTVVPQAPSQNSLTARVNFRFDGNIRVLDNLGAGLAFVDTGADWIGDGQYRNLTIAVDPGANTIDYFYDGALIYSSVAGVFAGTTTEQVVLFSDNFHAAGEVGDFDNLAITPEPTSLGLLALGALALIRRR